MARKLRLKALSSFIQKLENASLSLITDRELGNVLNTPNDIHVMVDHPEHDDPVELIRTISHEVCHLMYPLATEEAITELEGRLVRIPEWMTYVQGWLFRKFYLALRAIGKEHVLPGV